MDGEELGGTFVISVDELGVNGLWSTIKDVSDAFEDCIANHAGLTRLVATSNATGLWLAGCQLCKRFTAFE